MWGWCTVCVFASRKANLKCWQREDGGRDESASGPALLNLANYFPSAGTCAIVKTKSLHCCHSHLENGLFALIAYLSETYWDWYCRLKLTSQINECLLRENQNKRTNFRTYTQSLSHSFPPAYALFIEVYAHCCFWCCPITINISFYMQ